MKTIKRKPINLTTPVLFTAAEDNAPRGFNIEAYTGAVIDTWFGKLVFDISGMTSKAKMPVLREHYRDRVVGFGKGSQDGKVFSVSGHFSQTTRDAKECVALADEGYPWQASVGIRPVRVKTLSGTEEHLVNGQMLSGPAEIWLKSEVGEVSFVSLGADSATSISVFSDSAAEIEAELESLSQPQTAAAGTAAGPEKEIKPMTKDELLKQAPELAAALKAEGAAEERTRVTQILAADPEMKHLAVLKQAIEAGSPSDGVYKALFEAERKFRQTGLQTLADNATSSVGQSRTDAAAGNSTPTRTFFDEVAAAMKAQNITKAAAVRQVQLSHPELHAAFLAQQAA